MDHAVVVGAGIAGLCAARALAPYARRVTLIDQDALPVGAEPRRGVPQARHVHALLVAGRRSFERQFPGFDQAMAAGGALELDFGDSFAALRPNGWAVRAPAGVRSLWASRDLVESVIRSLARELAPVVELVARCDGLVGAAGAVRGVVVREADGQRRELPAELVVDASGRGSAAVDWLAALGHRAPAVDEVDADAGYASRIYAVDRARWPAAWWWRGVWIDGAPPDQPRAGVAFPIEGERLTITAVGLAGQHPPGDEAGFTDFLAGLRSPLIAELARCCRPLGPIHRSRSTQNRFRRFDRAAPVPGFVALGDAVCAFNPVYGQGMTVAALGAELLGRALARGAGPELPARFHAAQAELLAAVWQLATGADFMWPSTRGARPRGAALRSRISRSIFETATFDPELVAAISPVFHLLRPAADLFAPRILVRVARGSRARHRARRAAIPALPF